MVARRHSRLAHLRGWADRPPLLVEPTAAALSVQLEIAHEARDSRARTGVLHTPHGAVDTPFLAVVTSAGLLPAESRQAGASVMLARTHQLTLRPGAETVRELGGLHQFMGWNGPLMSDSGGFDVFSLGFDLGARRSPNQAPRLIRVDDDGATFTSYIDGSRLRLTPESSMAAQTAFGADIALALDEPTSRSSDADNTRRAMDRTHRWATRCLQAHERSDQALYGVIQGGAFEDLRTASASFTGGLPFAGAAIGGAAGRSTVELGQILDWTTPHLPPAWPRHLLGVGEPAELFAGVERGIDQFESVAPTRLARQGRVYTFDGELDVTRLELAEDHRLLADDCGCYTCATGFSRGYIRHLFAARELLAYTLASLHNLYFVEHLMQRMREAIRADQLTAVRDEFLARYCVGLA